MPTLAHALQLGLQGLSVEGLVAAGWPGAGAPPKTAVQQDLGLPTGGVLATVPETLARLGL